MDAILILAFVAAFAGSAVATWTGFGAATILTPVLASFLELHQVVLVVAIYHGIQNGAKVIAFRRGIVVQVAAWFGAGAIALAVAGGMLSSLAPASVLEIVLGGFLIFDSLAGLFGRASSTRDRRPPIALAITGGGLSGLAAGLIGTGGAVRALFLHRFLREKESYVATSALIAMMIDASRVPVYVSQYPAALLSGLWPVVVITVVAGLLGVLAARRFLSRVSTERFQKVLRIALLVAGCLFVFQGVRN